jgi:3',5'-cyclic AMP phosphodiesterase CpdA
MNPQQVAWLTNELKNSSSEWKVCYFHHPLYSSAKFHGPSRELRQVLEPLLIQYGVQVVFSGHDHVYERTKPQNGIHYFIEGAAGELRKGNLIMTDITAAGYDQDQSFLLVEILGDVLDFQAVSRLGVTVDHGTFSRK